MKHLLDCGDNSCRFMEMGKGGMRTNGGCRCIEERRNRPEIARRLMLADRMADFIKNRMWFLKGDQLQDAKDLVNQWYGKINGTEDRG